jgi:peptidoglycan/xylan/chitin deacetylase (PgdA/CDA1 family)
MTSTTVRNRKGTIVTTSWDDGNRCDLKLKKLLDKYQLKGTFYPAPSSKQFLSNEELRLIDNHHEIGAHTLNHPVLPEIPPQVAWDEIRESKFYLEDLLGHPVSMFCYPYGKYNTEIKDLVKKAGFVAARTTLPGIIDRESDPFEWPVTLHASNGSPRVTFNLWKDNRLPLKALADWEIRAKLLFDKVLREGGIFHLWGHSWELEQNNEWEKLDRVLQYLAHRKDVLYITNGRIFF